MRETTWICTTAEKPWHPVPEGQGRRPRSADPVLGEDEALLVDPEPRQEILGFGGAFNELGMVALSRLDEARRAEVLDALFLPGGGAGFTFCRLPIGASDFATHWYSYDEREGDLDLKGFSIDEDRRWLLPYVREAQARQPALRFFASPWSPPTWMKSPPVYNGGRLRPESEVQRAYARYLARYVRAYGAEGVAVGQLHVQNEPFADQKFPSCLWSADQFREFIGSYLGPEFELQGLDAEIWLGTLNGPENMRLGPAGMTLDPYHEYVESVLLDPEARRYVRGVGYQWAGRQNIARTRASFPRLGLMQTEGECGDGRNSWEYAFYAFTLIHHYLTNGACAYIAWNMALEEGGVSTWGWPQNSLVTVEPDGSGYRLGPEYYLMRHFSAFVRPGAVALATSGLWSSSALAFRDPGGRIAVVAANFHDRARPLSIEAGVGERLCYELPPRSISTILP